MKGLLLPTAEDGGMLDVKVLEAAVGEVCPGDGGGVLTQQGVDGVVQVAGEALGEADGVLIGVVGVEVLPWGERKRSWMNFRAASRCFTSSRMAGLASFAARSWCQIRRYPDGCR